MSTIFNSFFKDLSKRLYNENYLSDITASMIEASEVFREIFFSYIVGDKV